MPERIAADVDDRLARAFHQGYVETCVAMGESPEVNKSIRPWEELPEQLRQANFAQASHLGTTLARIQCVITPESDPPHDFAFTGTEVRQLAELEHERWVAERRSTGLEYGPVRDDRHHPDLVAWDELTDRARELDRDAVRRIPAVLRQAGFQILRLPPPAS